MNSKKLRFLVVLFLFGFNAFAASSDSGVGQSNAVDLNEKGQISAEKTTELATIGVMASSDFVPDRVKPQAGKLIGLPDVLAERIIEHLTNSKRFIIVERKALRRLVLEQRFGKGLQETYLDRTLDKAIDAMESVDGGAVIISPDKASPVGRARVGAGTVGTTGALSDYNDLIKNFQDLGTAVGADYLVLGNLEKLERKTKLTAVPYSTSGRTSKENIVDARLRLRVIDVRSGTVAGATSIRAKLVENIFDGVESNTDHYTFFDHLGQQAATKVLDVTFPARIVSIEPLVISRGANDGVNAGDVYLVEREGKELTDANGLVIAQLKSKVGKIEVISIQETVSVVKPLTGSGFIKGDLAGLDVKSLPETVPVAKQAKTPLKRDNPAASGKPNLPRVAIGLVKTGSTESTGNKVEENTPIFTDTIISRLAQTKRFQLIDRQEVDQLLDEQLAQALTENRGLPSAMGTLKGADYLVYGNLASLSVEEKELRLPGSSKIMKKKIAHVTGNMRIVDARSGDIIASRTVTVKEKVDPSAEESRVFSTLADAYAEQVVLMLMNAVYPIKIAHVGGDGTIYINRGDDGGLFVGETLQAFKTGVAIIDPDTGVQLGVEEILVGKVEVTSVEDARSKAFLIEGAKVSKGYILKRDASNTNKRASTVLQTKNDVPLRSGGMLNKTSKKAVQGQKKATIAVGLLKVTPGANTTRLTPGTLKQLTDELILKLSESNRFVVLERQEVDQVLDEKSFEAIASGGDIGASIKELLGADYLIHGEISNFYFKTTEKKVAILDEIRVTRKGIAEGNFRIVDVHSGAVQTGSKIFINKKYSHGEDINLLFSDLRDEYLTQSVEKIIINLFPIKVLGIAGDGIVYLNRGADSGVKIGLRYDVMRASEEFIDPDTGRSAGRAEVKVSEIEVVSVEANRSRAKFISGTDAISGDILRKENSVKKSQPKMLQPAW